MWEEAIAAIQRHMVVQLKSSGLKIVAELPNGVGSDLSPKMDHLVCFLPGSIMLGITGGHTLREARAKSGWSDLKEQQVDLAKDLMKTCWAMYAVTETGLAPEIAWFHVKREDLKPQPGGRSLRPANESVASWKEDFIIKSVDAHNLQRPETIESLFLMWRITEDPIYRDLGWDIFMAFEKYTKVAGGGYTSINNVNEVPPPQRDNMESFWLVSAMVSQLLALADFVCRLRRSNIFTCCFHRLIFCPWNKLSSTRKGMSFRDSGHSGRRAGSDGCPDHGMNEAMDEWHTC